MSIAKFKDIMTKTALSSERFTTAYCTALVFFFLPYALKFEGRYSLFYIPLALGVAFAALPIAYALIHRYSPVLFGRYHLALPATGLLTALFFVFVWSGKTGGAADNVLCFFGVALFAVTLLVYRYCVFSVRVRLVGDDFKRPSVYDGAVSALGIAGAVATLYGFYVYDESTMFINSAYVLGAVTLIFVFAQYFASYTEIPNLGGKRPMSVAAAFKECYCGIRRRTYLSSLFFVSAFLAVASVLVYAVKILGLGSGTAFLSAMLAVIAYMTVSALFSRFELPNLHSTVATAVFLALAAVFVTVAAFAGDAASGLIPTAAVFAGAGGGLCVRRMRVGFMSVKTSATSGIIYIITELCTVAAASICALCDGIVGAAYGIGGAALTIAGGAAVMFVIAATVLGLWRGERTALAVTPVGFDGNTDEADPQSNGSDDRSITDEAETAEPEQKEKV